MKRPVQHLYLLELSCDIATGEGIETTKLNAEAAEFRPRGAVVAARSRNQMIVED